MAKRKNHKKKNWFLAFVVALIIPGVGHIYCRRWLLGLVFLLTVNPITLIQFLDLVNPIIGNGPHNWIIVLFWLSAWVAQALDAAQMATNTKVK